MMAVGTGVSKLGRLPGEGLVERPRAGTGLGCKSATLTVCIAAKAGIFLDLFAPGTPDSNVAQFA